MEGGWMGWWEGRTRRGLSVWMGMGGRFIVGGVEKLLGDISMAWV